MIERSRIRVEKLDNAMHTQHEEGKAEKADSIVARHLPTPLEYTSFNLSISLLYRIPYPSGPSLVSVYSQLPSTYPTTRIGR